MKKKVAVVGIVVLLCVSSLFLVACNEDIGPKYGTVLCAYTIGMHSGAVVYDGVEPGYYVEISATDSGGNATGRSDEQVVAVYYTTNEALWLQTTERMFWENSSSWTRQR